MAWIVGGVTGYVIGAALAVFLDRLYTGAPWRGPAPAWQQGAPALWWTGTLGYALARGRGEGGVRLPARLWYLPLLGAPAGAAIAVRAHDPRHAALLAMFSTVLLAFVGSDFERHLLPNRLMYPTLALALALSWTWPDRSFAESLAGGLAGFAIMFALFFFLPGFGFGDVKLAALIGLLVGLSNTLPALLIGAIAGGVGAGLMLLAQRLRLGGAGAGARTAIAYGPYLVLGAFAVMVTR